MEDDREQNSFAPNRFYTRNEAEQVVAAAIETFLTRERGVDKVPDLVLRREGGRSGLRAAKGEPLRMHDEARYLAEMARLGLDMPSIYLIDKNAPEMDELLEELDDGGEGGITETLPSHPASWLRSRAVTRYRRFACVANSTGEDYATACAQS